MGEFLPGGILDRLKELRQAKGYTLSDVANKLGISTSTYQRIESGQTKKISNESLRELAKLYDVPTDFIMGTTNVDENIYYEIEELGLTYESAARMYERRVDMEVLNILIQSDNFAKLLQWLSIYGTESGIEGVKLVNSMKNFTINEIDEQIELGLVSDTEDIRKDQMLIDFSKDNPYQYDLDRLRHLFMLVAKDVKANMIEKRKELEEQEKFRKEALAKLMVTSKSLIRNYKMPIEKKKKILAKRTAELMPKELTAEQKLIIQDATEKLLDTEM